MPHRHVAIDVSAGTTFGTQLRLLRRRARLTQAELGRAVGYSDAQISRLEMGRRPPDLSILVALFFPALGLEAYSADAHDLLRLADEARRVDGEQVARPVLALEDAPMPEFNRPTLPLPTTTLIGRTHERQALRLLLGDPNVRLVTLLGTAGVGKTHLALQIAHDLSMHFSDGVYFVDLSPMNEAELVLPTLARALDLPTDESGDLRASVIHALQRRHVLVILDNFEQVREAAPLLGELLLSAAGLHLLVTSRVALHLQVEHRFALEPLAVPDLANLPPLATLTQIESMALLLSRLRTVAPEFLLKETNALPLAAICVRTDGLPLAIELIAARGRLLGPQALLTEITQHFMQLRRHGHDIPPRHQTLTAALDWSYAQLPQAAQVTFARLSILPGSWRTDTACAVCDLEDRGRAALFEHLELLLDHSLLQREMVRDTGRLHLLTMVREFAHVRLTERGESDLVQQRLLSSCLELAEQARQEMNYSAGLADWIARLEAEHELIRAALRYALDSGKHESGLRLASALRVFWYTRGYLREGRSWIEHFLQVARTGQSQFEQQLRATALDDAGILAWRQGDYYQAASFSRDAVLIHQRINNTTGQARALMHLGLISFDRGDTGASQVCYEQSLALYRTLGTPVETVGVLHNLANLYNQLNESAQALSLYQECLRIYQQIGDTSGLALVSLGIGVIYRDLADPGQAIATLTQSQALFRELGDTWSVAVAELNLGDLAADAGDFATARQRLHLALAEFQTIGDQQMISTTHGRLGDVELLAGVIPTAIEHFRQCLMLAHGLDFQHGIASGLEGLAGCAAVHQPLVASRLLGCAATIRASTGVPIPLADQPRYEYTLELARTHSEAAAWAAAWDEGTQLSPARAVTLALSIVTPR
ncbi:tetratricopeptide repeat protein [Candidatus Chloroploca sp. Khr17]|uniref:ATP-binding protein n=1 Tax=Candidatus Chloroploca sp. Khr17 TaxID=2496869 RepID=UPI00101CC6AC|nr:tetratricopeptide repeat protein [Candidatus Chloroploca sp. Khr17]